jgi:hypothetical protein
LLISFVSGEPKTHGAWKPSAHDKKQARRKKSIGKLEIPPTAG